MVRSKVRLRVGRGDGSGRVFREGFSYEQSGGSLWGITKALGGGVGLSAMISTLPLGLLLMTSLPLLPQSGAMS